MEKIVRKMSLVVVALVLLATGTQTVELQARGEGHMGGGSHSMGGSRGSSQGRSQHSNSSRGNRSNEGRGNYGRHHGDHRDGRGNRNGYYDDSGAWIVPGAIGLGVGAVVLGEDALVGDEECPEGTYFDERTGRCREE